MKPDDRSDHPDARQLIDQTLESEKEESGDM